MFTGVTETTDGKFGGMILTTLGTEILIEGIFISGIGLNSGHGNIIGGVTVFTGGIEIGMILIFGISGSAGTGISNGMGVIGAVGC